MSRISKAVQVLVYRQESGGYWCATKVQYWHGSSRWNLRLAKVHPIPDPFPCPYGVQEEVWWAYSALRAEVTRQRSEALGSTRG